MVLEALIALCIVYYFGVLQHQGPGKVLLILMWSVVGILGSYSVAWFGIRMNTYANSRTAFASLRGKPLPVYEIPTQAGMSIGVLLICVELVMMLVILLFVPREAAGASFLGFAIGESLGASALRIAGGIFTKIADIGSDLMKIVFRIKEDDPRNPGVIADCTGDNAGDSVGPTAGRLRDLRRDRRCAHLLHRARGDAGAQVAPAGVDLRDAHPHDRDLDRSRSR
jgi:K(+)-stimulated pyrophosphate-energized sodium pump